MTEDGTPSVNPKLDAICDMLKAIHNLQKRITELEKENAELKSLNKEITYDCHKLVNALENWQNENVELLGKVAFLENDLNDAKAQIEKMKCCGNCKNYWRMCEYGDREMQICDKWELKNE